MGCKLLAVFYVVVTFLSGNYRNSFVDSAPLDVKNAYEGQNLQSWKKYNRNKNFEYFDRNEEKEWNGPFYFIQGADVQFGFIARELENKKIITWEKENRLAEDFVKRINEMNPKPRFFVLCGDLCDAMPAVESEMREKQEQDFKRIFGKLDENIPLVCVCGNHDVGNTPTKETVLKYRSSFGDDFFSFWCGGVLFLVLNSQYFYDSSEVSDIAEEHGKWIDEALNKAQREKKYRYAVVFQHIPWFLKSIDEEESYFAINKELRQKWLDKFKKAGVKAVFCGHYHQNAGGIYNELDVVVTSAIGGQLGNDQSGARVVKVLENKIEHEYYGIINSKFNDETVKELESLKNALREGETGNGDEITISKSQTSVFSNVNGRKTAYDEIKNRADKNGKLFAQVAQKVDIIKNKEGKPKSMSEVEVEIPSKGIHNVIFKNEGNLEVPPVPSKKDEGSNEEPLNIDNGIDKINSLSGVEYSPLDMAEYIFWTGDEKGVALTIEEFLEQGLMTRQEAINFLQSIKFNLDFMQAHYQGLQKMDDKISNKARNIKHELLNQEKPKLDMFEEQQNKAKLIPYDFDRPKSESFEITPPVTKIKQMAYEDRPNENVEQDYSLKRSQNREGMKSEKKLSKEMPLSDEDYEEILEKLKVADSLYKEYSLEKVIFQLAKVMFSQSLTKGNKEAQKALQHFTSFLQNEVKQGQISNNLERKILDVLITALMDTLMEHPELVAAAREELQSMADLNSPSSLMLKQLLMSEVEIRTSGKSNLKELTEKASLSGKEKSSQKTLEKVE